jgi:acyl carrier protein
MATIAERVKKVVSEQYGIAAEALKESMNFTKDLAGDSIDSVELIMMMEEEFDIDISDEDAEKIKTVGDIIKFMEKMVGDW